MGNRLERVYQALCDLGANAGISAQALAEAVGIDRSNASRELNRLVAAGQARKVSGKPVRFSAVPGELAEAPAPAAGWLAPAPAPALPPAPPPPAAPRLEAALPLPPAAPGAPLDGLQGATGSLRNAVALAKAAMLYPGGGLHTLILGPSGAGKSLFAEEMYRFAAQHGAVTPEAPFTVFNCADYAANPQLLLSQLFGAAKGAYTGAAADRAGVVEQTAGGILFLDEIHRLPPEGQEMLFLLLDRGQFRRLGETRLRSVTLRVISATTEDPESSLLGTFLRRIPMVIKLPALAERPVNERLELILHCFQTEADRVGMPIEVTARVMSRLIRYTPRGNVGRLKADIQLACARAFLDEVRSPGGIVRVDEPSLPPLESGAQGPAAPATPLPGLGAYRFTPGATEGRPAAGIGDAIYERITRRVRELEAEGRSAESGSVITAEIDEYFAGVSEVDPAWQQAVERLVGPQALSWAGEMLDQARAKLGPNIDPRARVGLAMHIASTLDRIRQGKAITYPRLKELRQRYPQEMEAAAGMAARLQRLTGVTLPPDETGFLASFLLGLGGRARGQVGVLVACHGTRTARSLVETVRELVGESVRLDAVDWPLGEPLEQFLPRAEEALRTLDAGQGVLLLVDMGPLVALGELLTERTGIPTRTVDMVSTARLLEAARKARVTDMGLDDLARLVIEAPTLARPARSVPGRPVLLTLCLTGEGSARHLAAMLTQSLPELAEHGVEVMTGALAGDRPAAAAVADLLRQRPVIGVVSTFDPGDLPVPVVLLEELLMGTGIARLRYLLAGLNPAGPTGAEPLPPLTPEREQLLRRMAATLARQLKSVDPAQAAEAAGRALRRLEAMLGVPLSLDLFAGMAMHLACLVDERLSSPTTEDSPQAPAGETARKIGQAMAELERTFGIRVPASHLERMAKMIGG